MITIPVDLARFVDDLGVVSGGSDGLIVKHYAGQHDQSSHGNWAGGISVQNVSSELRGGVKVYTGTVTPGAIGYRGVRGSELWGPGGAAAAGVWRSYGTYNTSAERGTSGSTMFSSSQENLSDAVHGYQLIVKADIGGLRFRTLREPNGGVVDADIGLGLGITDDIPLDRIMSITDIRTGESSLEFFRDVVAEENLIVKHYAGRHDQSTHGNWAGGAISMGPGVAASILERVKANGGLSVNMLDGSEPTSGFMVAKGGTKGAIVDASEFFDPQGGADSLSSFLKTYRTSLTKGSYLGLWHNTGDGKVYLDVSDNIQDRQKAITAGKRRNQISIWDVANFEEVNTGGTGELAKEIASRGTSRLVKGNGRRDRQVRATDLGEVRSDPVVIRFAPGLVPVLKHATHDQQTHGNWATGNSGVVSAAEAVRISKSRLGRGVDVIALGEPKRAFTSNSYTAGRINEQGFNEPSPVVSREDFIELAKSGDYEVIYRGGPSGIADGMISGEPWIGDGIGGPGSYFAPVLNPAIFYAERSKAAELRSTSGEVNEVMVALLPKAAKEGEAKYGIGTGADYIIHRDLNTGYMSRIVYNTGSLIVVDGPRSSQDAIDVARALGVDEDDLVASERTLSLMKGDVQQDTDLWKITRDGKLVHVWSLSGDVVKHQQHDQSTHGNWAHREGSLLSDSFMPGNTFFLEALGRREENPERGTSTWLAKRTVSKNIADRMKTETEVLAKISNEYTDYSEMLGASKGDGVIARDDNGHLSLLVGPSPFPDDFGNPTYSWRSYAQGEYADKDIFDTGTPEARQVIREAAVSDLVRVWAETSNNTATALAIQHAAAMEFNLSGYTKPKDILDPVRSNINLIMSESLQRYGTREARAVLRDFVSAQYAETQQLFAENGISEVEIYRGMTMANPPTSGTSVNMRPLSSWSLSANVAESFALDTVRGRQEAVTMKATVPVSRILSTPITGVGCLAEGEVVILGGTMEVKIQNDDGVYKASAINIDTIENADWIKTLSWDMPTTVEGMAAAFGPDWRATAVDQVSWLAAPESLKVFEASPAVVIKFAPGLKPILKHAVHDQSTHGNWADGGRIGVYTGRRTDTANQQKNDRNLVFEATTMSALPDAMQARIKDSLNNLGVTPQQMENNIQSVLDRAKAAGDPPNGQNWYEEANAAAQDISDNHGISREQSAGMVAAMSPQQPWGDNVTAAEYTAKALHEKHAVQVDDLIGKSLTKGVSVNGKLTPVTKTMYEWAQAETDGKGSRKMDGATHKMPTPDELRGKTVDQLDPYVAASLIKAHGQMGYRVSGVGNNVDGQQLKTVDDLTGLPAPVKFTCGVHHMGRAVRIANGESPDQVLNGHKVRSFYNNINGDQSVGTYSDDVTVDSHAFSVAMGQKFGSGSTEYGYFAGAGWPDPANTKEAPLPALYPPVGSKTPGVSGAYAAFADAYRAVAQRNGLTARQVQAITWVQWRKDNPDQTRGGQMAAMEVQNG